VQLSNALNVSHAVRADFVVLPVNPVVVNLAAVEGAFVL
jgi:hypothetical protein